MKAWVLVFSLFFGVLALPAQALSSSKVELSAEKLNDIKGALKSQGKTHAQASEPEELRLKLGDHKADLMELGGDLYYAGYFSLQHLKAFESAIDSNANLELCVQLNASQCGDALWGFFKNFYDQNVANLPPSCKGEGVVATAGQCCEGLDKLPNFAHKPVGSELEEGRACQTHEQCASKLCDKDLDSESGICVGVYSCYDRIAKNGECSEEKPYCENACAENDPNCDTQLFCAPVNYNSSGVGECKGEDLSCSSNNECCSDKCKAGKCVPKSICTDCAKMGSKPKPNQQCCPGTYKDLNGTCIQDFPPFTLPTVKVEKSIFEKVLNFIIPSAHAAACVVQGDGLTTAQRAQYEACVKEKTLAPNVSAENIADATSDCDQMRASFLEQNKANQCQEGTYSRKDYRDIYNMPEILSKSFSNVNECEFNSMNDSWKSKTYIGKNAELALRAFEFTYSGKGSDMIISGSKLEPGGSAYYGKSIFERAQSIAFELRKNRYKLIERFRELDLQITCKCLSAFGPTEFNSEKQAFYQQSCDAQQGFVAEEQINTEGGEPVTTEGETDEIATVDKGAVGISHEKLILEWLDLKRQAEIAFFVNNEKIEDDMKALRDFVSNYNWDETPTTETKEEKLYSFYTIYPASGFFRWVVAIIGFIAFGFQMALSYLFNGSGITGKASLGPLATGTNAKTIAMAAGIASIMNGGVFQPNIKDKKIQDDKCWNTLCTREYDKYDRYLEYPYFDNKKISSVINNSKNRCEIYGQSGQCIKSVYLVSHQYKNDTTVLTVDNQPLLDAVLPVTVSANAYKVEELKNGETYAKLLNARYAKGKQALIDARTHYFKKKGSRYYMKKKYYNESHGNQVFSKEQVMKEFTIDGGNWAPKHFNQFKKAYIDGAVKYAMCKQLSECAQHSSETIGTGETSKKHIGFGFLFESEEDAKIFGEYAYQMHLLWPRISDSRISYPTLGMVGYFQTMYYNLRLAGSLALQQANEITHLYNLYLADWEKRKGDYRGLGGAVRGTISSNSKLTPAVYDQLATLQLNDSASINAFNTKVNSASSASSKFSNADLSALKAASRHAVRTNDEIKAREHYDSTYGKTARGKLKSNATESFVAAFNSPLDRMKLELGGKALGGLGGADKGAPSFGKKAKVKKMDQFASLAPSKLPSNTGGAPQLNFNFEEEETLNTDLTNEEAEVMVKAAKIDSSLDPVEGESLFKTVSKAYKRNLGKVLTLKSDLRERAKMNIEDAQENEDISNDDKARLRKLLRN